MAEVRAFDRTEIVGFRDVPGWVVLLDADMNEITERQPCRFSWGLIPGGATYSVITSHEFDISGKSVTYMAVGGGDHRLFVSIAAGHPVENSARMLIT